MTSGVLTIDSCVEVPLRRGVQAFEGICSWVPQSSSICAYLCSSPRKVASKSFLGVSKEK